MGVWLSELGTSCTWREASVLIEHFMSSTDCHLGADLAGWQYPASLIEIVQLAHYGGKDAPFPWAGSDAPTQEEVEEGIRALEQHSAFKGG